MTEENKIEEKSISEVLDTEKNTNGKNEILEDLDNIELVEAINWNNIEDDLDKVIWDTLVSNFWIDTKIPLSNDLKSWENFTKEEKESTVRVFAGLTLLDTIQSKVGAISLIPDAITPHEEAVLTNIAFMESVHAKSYSSIFSTLISTGEIDDAFRWSRENENLKRKAQIILKYYEGSDPLKRKIASTMLESFLFYSGFFMPLYWATKAKLTNTADIIKLIIRDESIHGIYIGMKFQRGYEKESDARKAELEQFTNDILDELYHNELQYTQDLYDPLGLSEEVKSFLRYNANKALQNLGFEPRFSKAETEILPEILASLNPGGETHDFFSGAGSAYQIIEVEETSDDDWDF